MLPPSITIREVGPRDGLQPEQPLAVADRLLLISSLVAAGARHIEATAFVSPKAVPAMTGAGQVVAGLPRTDGVTYWALVPNLKGAELALTVGVDHLSVTVSASEEYSRRNVGMSVADSVGQAAKIAAAAPVVDVVVSCAFGSPYEGEIAPSAVAALMAELEGVTFTVADTTGMATPRRVGELIDAVGSDVGMHFHDTRGTALVNAYSAMELGVDRFDTAVGGLGGSPFAAGAGGNLATEDLVHLCDDLYVDTGFDLEALLVASTLVGTLIGRQVPSRLAAAGPRDRRAGGPLPDPPSTAPAAQPDPVPPGT